MTSTKPFCPDCKGTKLQISLPTWFRFDDIHGPLDATTLVEVDAEAEGEVFCEDCEEWFSAKLFYDQDHEPHQGAAESAVAEDAARDGGDPEGAPEGAVQG